MQRSIPGSLRFASKATSYAVMAIATLGLAACGGGGGGGNNNPPPSGPSTQQPPPANTAPTVNAGEDQTIRLPTATVELSGSATDAENNTLTYAWTSSPADGVTFANATAAATQATFTTAGAYTLTLTANDGTTTGSDTVVITVEPADGAPPPVETAWPGPDPSETDPNHGWATANPVDVGMDSARLQEAVNYAIEGGGGGMITRHGKLVVQWSDPLDPNNTDDDIDIDEKQDLKSTTKSIASIALGIAIDRNLIALSDTAQSRYANFGVDPTDTTPPNPAWLSQITIQQLATHTAGYDKPSNARVDLLHEPGTQWTYSDGGLNWLADTLTNVFQQDLQTVLNEAVWRKLHITGDDLTWRVPTGANARPPIGGSVQAREFSAGITANANAMARIGLLFLRKGKWQDEQIISESFVQTVSTPRPETAQAQLLDPAGFPSANEGYGVMWWTNATGQLPNVPRDAYWAWGLGDSLIVVIPSLDIVVARVPQHPDSGVKRWRAGWNGDYTVLDRFLTPIVQSVTPAP